jgi:hypothetical protein
MPQKGELSLAARLHHYDKDIRTAAVKSLAGRADRDALALLENVYRNDPEESVRALAQQVGQRVLRHIREQDEFERMLEDMPPDDPFAGIADAPGAPVLSRKLAAEGAPLPPMPPSYLRPPAQTPAAPVNQAKLWGGIALYSLIMTITILISWEYTAQSPQLEQLRFQGRGTYAFVMTFTRTLMIISGLLSGLAIWLHTGIMHLLAVHAFNGYGSWRKLTEETVFYFVGMAAVGLVTAPLTGALMIMPQVNSTALVLTTAVIQFGILGLFTLLFGGVIARVYWLDIVRARLVFAINSGFWIVFTLASLIVNLNTAAANPLF